MLSKTTVLFKLKLGKVMTTIHAVGFNVETVQYKDIHFTMWDVCGREKIRHYFEITDAVIFVVGITDKERIDEAKNELDILLDDDNLKDASLLVLRNKVDLPKSLTTAELTERLCLQNHKGRDWFIRSTCAVSGEVLMDGLE